MAPSTFVYFEISGDPLNALSLNVVSSGTGTFLDQANDGLFGPNTDGTTVQIEIDTPTPVDITTSSWPTFTGTGSGVEIYTADVNGQPVTFAYITSSGDGFDDGVDRIVVISGTLKDGDTIGATTLETTPSDNPLDFDTVVCFAAGTLIDTPHGPVPVEDLRPGDLVLTRDNGPQPLTWVGQQELTAAQLASAPRLQPFLIPAGALGPDEPTTDLIVSPQHRILVSTPAMQMNLGMDEALVAAKHLRCARRQRGRGVTYVHLMFARHEIVRSNGVWSESLFVGPEARRSAQAEEFLEVFGERPALSGIDAATPAMVLSLPALKGWEVELT
ncbi:MAG: Hint domain-containing protein [Rhodobacteraceae bacterium]|nr:Hint domain-containing protein [Paracoccaceae bacterium]